MYAELLYSPLCHPLLSCCKGKVFGLSGFPAWGCGLRSQLCLASVCSRYSGGNIGGVLVAERESHPAMLSPRPLSRIADEVAWRWPHSILCLLFSGCPKANSPRSWLLFKSLFSMGPPHTMLSYLFPLLFATYRLIKHFTPRLPIAFIAGFHSIFWDLSVSCFLPGPFFTYLSFLSSYVNYLLISDFRIYLRK